MYRAVAYVSRSSVCLSRQQARCQFSFALHYFNRWQDAPATALLRGDRGVMYCRAPLLYERLFQYCIRCCSGALYDAASVLHTLLIRGFISCCFSTSYVAAPGLYKLLLQYCIRYTAPGLYKRLLQYFIRCCSGALYAAASVLHTLLLLIQSFIRCCCCGAFYTTATSVFLSTLLIQCITRLCYKMALLERLFIIRALVLILISWICYSSD